MNPATAVFRFLRAPRTALATMAFLAVYSSVGTWTDLIPHPFTAPPFLIASGLLFLSTLVCVMDRSVSTMRLWRGKIPGGTLLPRRNRIDFAAFLLASSFTRRGDRFFRFRHALWGGWLLHLGILVVIAAVLIQQGFRDAGSFELTEGEQANLSAHGVVFGREAGPFASATPPALDVALTTFDPYLHQRGYAADRGSRLLVDGTERFLDRARGTEVRGLTIFQAIPTGIAINLDIDGIGPRTIHLRRSGPREAMREVNDPRGTRVRFLVRSERPIDDPSGTGSLTLFLAPAACTIGGNPIGQRIEPAAPFDFGGRHARVAGFQWWGGFTYTRTPGASALFAGFAVTLLGCVLLLFPSAVAQPAAGEECAGWIYAKRGIDVLVTDWASFNGTVETAASSAPAPQLAEA